MDRTTIEELWHYILDHPDDAGNLGRLEAIRARCLFSDMPFPRNYEEVRREQLIKHGRIEFV